MKNRNVISTRQRGVTLIELMVAVTLGLLISAGVGSLFVQGSRSHTQDDRYLRMIEHGRFAIGTIAEDLRMISFWGEMLDPAGISTALVAGEDCSMGLFDGATPVLTNNPQSVPAVTQFDVTANTCPALTGTVRANTNQLAIKHTSGTSITAGHTDNTVYVRTNGSAGEFIQFVAGTTAAPTGNFSDWLYRPALYYIRDDAAGMPYLCRLQINALALGATTVDECIAEGVEQFYVQFGIDSDTDGFANQYKSNPTAAEMSDAVTARIYVLVRSATPDPLQSNGKTYNLGDLAVTPGDNFYRRVFSTTVQLRNPANLAMLR